MNKLVNFEFDNFEKRTKINLRKNISPSILDNTLGLEDVVFTLVASKEGENEPKIFLITAHNSSDIEITKILIKLDKKDIISYDVLLRKENGFACEITNIFQKLCEAQIIEIRLKNDNGHVDLSSEYFGIGARAIYNAIIDDSAYVDEIQQQEQIDAEDNKIVEQERITNIEKYTQRDNRIKNRGVNKFFKAEYDKFTQKLEVTYNGELELETLNATMLLIKSNFDFRYVHIGKDNPILIIDIEAISQTNLNLKEGELMLLLNESERLILNPHENYSEPHLESFYRESCWYALTEDELKSLCEAQSVEMRITNGNKHADLSTKDVQLLSRRFYNAIIDETAYTDDLLTQEERDAAERERQRQEYRAEQERLRKEREAKEAEEARIRAERRAEWWQQNGKKVIRAAIISVALLVLIIVGLKTAQAITNNRAISKAEAIIEQADALIATYQFDEAQKICESGLRNINNEEARHIVLAKEADIRNAKNKADEEYENTLKKLRILLDADDYVFNQYSNECLDKMIQTYPKRKETIYYQNMRGK